MQFQKLSIPLHSLSTRKQVDYKVAFWRDGRVVDYNGLENRRTERYRGFESLSLRKQGCKSTNYVICTLYYTPKKESIPAKSCKTSWGLYSRPLKTIFQHKVCIDKLYADSFYKVQKNSHSSFEVICCCS